MTNLEPLHIDHRAIGTAHILDQMLPLVGDDPGVAAGDNVIRSIVVAQVHIGIDSGCRIEAAQYYLAFCR